MKTAILSRVRTRLKSGEAAPPAFSPASLFASGEEGVWYEISPDTCFTDISGTTPASVGDAVAYFADSSGNGNHATQVTADARPILARVPETGRRNLLEYTEEFDNAVWVKNAGVVSANADGVADELKEPASGNFRLEIHQDTVAVAEIGKDYTLRLKIKEVTSTPKRYLAVATSSLGFGSQNVVIFDPADGSVTSDNGNGGTPTTSGPDVDGYYTVTITDTAIESKNIRFIVYSTNSATAVVNYAYSGASIAYVKEAQLEEGSTATAYQKVVDEYDITEAGVNSVLYAFDDEVDDAMNWTAPADTDYTISYVDTAGNVTTLTGQSLSGATDILLDPALVGYLAIDRALTAGETTDLESYLEGLT